jgi:hypothetical protein
MSETRFRFVCAPSALTGAPAGWAREMLREGEVALLGDEGLEAVNAVAHELDLVSVSLIRAEDSTERQDATVTAYAESLPLIWVAESFTEGANAWARERGPMTLLSQSSGPLGDEERRRIDRFVAILSRQSE